MQAANSLDNRSGMPKGIQYSDTTMCGKLVWSVWKFPLVQAGGGVCPKLVRKQKKWDKLTVSD